MAHLYLSIPTLLLSWAPVLLLPCPDLSNPPNWTKPSAAAPQPTRTGIAWRTTASLSPQAVFSWLLKTCLRAGSYCLLSPTEQIVVTQALAGQKKSARPTCLFHTWNELIPLTLQILFSKHLNMFWCALWQTNSKLQDIPWDQTCMISKDLSNPRHSTVLWDDFGTTGRREWFLVMCLLLTMLH